MTTKAQPIASYFFTYVALVALALASMLWARLGGPADLVVSLAIAAVKALIVMWFFMHLREQRLSSGLGMVFAVMWIALLGAFIATDVVSRHTFPSRPEPLSNEAFYAR